MNCHFSTQQSFCALDRFSIESLFLFGCCCTLLIDCSLCVCINMYMHIYHHVFEVTCLYTTVLFVPLIDFCFDVYFSLVIVGVLLI